MKKQCPWSGVAGVARLQTNEEVRITEKVTPESTGDYFGAEL